MKRIKKSDLPGIYWRIFAENIYSSKYEPQLVELSWGWTAGMTKKDMKNIADDCPTGYDSVITDMRSIIKLRDSLNELIKKNPYREPIRTKKQKAFNDRNK